MGVTTVSGNQTLAKTTANAIRVLDHLGHSDIPVAAGAERPLVRERSVAAEVHGETGLDGPDLPAAARDPVRAHAIYQVANPRGGRPRPRDARGDRSADQRRAAAGAPPGVYRQARARGADGRSDRRGERHAGRRV